MRNFFLKLLAFACRVGIALRYRVRIEGLEKLKGYKNKSLLFLPNHVSRVDSFLLTAYLAHYPTRPLVVEYIYRLRFLNPILKFLKALPVPDFETSVNQLKIEKGNAVLKEMAQSLKEGDSLMVFPSGRVKRTPEEVIGGASATYTMLTECPQAIPVLIRISGFWGSSFSHALKDPPDLGATIKKAAKNLFKNGIFFLPRRRITITIEPNPADLPRNGSRLDLNKFLENWYNQYPTPSGSIVDKEPLQLISTSCLRQELPQVKPARVEKKKRTQTDISNETIEKVYSEIRRITDSPSKAIDPSLSLTQDLGMDSLDVAELVSALSWQFETESVHPEDIRTVEDALAAAEGAKTRPKAAQPNKPVSTINWKQEEANRPDPQPPVGDTLIEAFLHTCKRMGKRNACGDDIIGVRTYQELKLGVFALAEYFKTIACERIAIMLPASVSASLTILAVQVAGKVPVMLNWTLGSRYLDQVMEQTQTEVVVSSWKFLEKLAHVQFGKLVDQIQFLEDIRRTVNLKMKIKGFIRSKLPFKTPLKNRPAVILFTSGTEGTPKGVPLSHENILSNIRSLTARIQFLSTDCLYAVLPPFHSLGFTVTGLAPLLIGLKTTYFPDPTDYAALAEGIGRWKATVFCTAPTFLKNFLSVARPNQLEQMRIIATGAEKTPPDLASQVKKQLPQASLLDGYGVTECSPCISIASPQSAYAGVGPVLPGIEVRIIHPETHQLIPSSTDGEICIHGPNVFAGYLNAKTSPFVELEGKRWYRTGDIGKIDSNNNLIISGRLKRFTKIGGEMVSLTAIEETLLSAYATAQTPIELAVCSNEEAAGKPRLILFINQECTKDSANQILKENGFSTLIKISEVRYIEEIPRMGVGKVDYKILQSQLQT